MSDWFDVEEVDDRVFALVEPHTDSVTSYLVEGQKLALLVDTGLGIGNIRTAVEELTQKPITVVNTHAHYDHVGGNRLFAGVAAHSAEVPALQRGVDPEIVRQIADPRAFLVPAPRDFVSEDFSIPPSRVIRVLGDGDIFDLGGRSLRVIHTPGHSAGEICLWEEAKGVLLAGDTIYYGNLFACFPGSDFDDYRKSLDRLSDLVPLIRSVLPGHGPLPLQAAVIDELSRWFNEIAAGAVQARFTNSPWGRVRFYSGGRYNLILKA